MTEPLTVIEIDNLNTEPDVRAGEALDPNFRWTARILPAYRNDDGDLVIHEDEALGTGFGVTPLEALAQLVQHDAYPEIDS